MPEGLTPYVHTCNVIPFWDLGFADARYGCDYTHRMLVLLTTSSDGVKPQHRAASLKRTHIGPDQKTDVTDRTSNHCRVGGAPMQGKRSTSLRSGKLLCQGNAYHG